MFSMVLVYVVLQHRGSALFRVFFGLCMSLPAKSPSVVRLFHLVVQCLLFSPLCPAVSTSTPSDRLGDLLGVCLGLWKTTEIHQGNGRVASHLL